MLEEIYDYDESLTEDDYYDALIYLLGDTYPGLSEEELEEVLEDLLEQMPEQQAEDVLNTVGGIAKKFGSGAIKFAGQNPALVKGAFKVAGSAFGPLGTIVGGKLGDIVTKTGQNKIMPETGKALAIIQNPQTRAALALGSMGVGNGTAPLIVNDNKAYVTVASYLRAMITVAQSALIELDRNNVVPQSAVSESLPFADDVDMQAEWLVEQLLGSASKMPPIKISVNTYFIYSSGTIERFEFQSSNIIAYVYVDDFGGFHNLGRFDISYTGKWVKNKNVWSQSTTDFIELVFIKTLKPYSSNKVKLAVKNWDSESQRYYVNPDCLAGFLGAMAENNIEDIKFNGASKKDGSSKPSSSHYNGEAIDISYLRTDFSGESCTLTTLEFDYVRQVAFNNSLYKFGFARNGKMYSESFKRGKSEIILPHSTHMADHYHHLHIRGFNHNLVEKIQFSQQKYTQIDVPPRFIAEPDATKVFINEPQMVLTK